MKVINLAGQPSAGKSTTAAGLFYLMKHAGLNVELIDEYAKQMTWEKRFGTLADQLYILAKQNRKLERLRGQVDYVISDSPLFLGRIYNQSNKLPSLNSFIMEVFNSYDNLNFIIQPHKPYRTVGRNQTEHEAAVIGKEIEGLLIQLGVPYQTIKGDKDAPEKIFNIINQYATR